MAFAKTGRGKRAGANSKAVRDDVKARPRTPAGEEQIARVRKLCLSLPGTTEKLSHGEPTFFVAKRVYAMFSNNHHNDGHIAVWIPVEPGYQATLLKSSPLKYYYPPYVGVKGWVGIELNQVDDDELSQHLIEAWQLISKKR